jgi:hypothetical protein
MGCAPGAKKGASRIEPPCLRDGGGPILARWTDRTDYLTERVIRSPNDQYVYLVLASDFMPCVLTLARRLCEAKHPGPSKSWVTFNANKIRLS